MRAQMVLGLVPVRAGSKGVPGKNLRLLGGLPLMAHTLRAAQEASRIARVVVSTDSPDARAIAEQYGAEAPFLRPAELAADDTPMIDVVRHALAWLRDTERHEPDIVVLLQATVPFRPPRSIDDAVARLEQSDADAIVSVAPVAASFHPDWQLRIRDGLLQRYDGRPLRSLIGRRQDLDPTFTRDGAIYAWKTAAFWRTGSIYGDRTLALVHEERPINIDTWDDWQRAEAVAARSSLTER